MAAQDTPVHSDLAEPEPDRSPLRYFGWYLTVIGISHLIFPRPWDRITAIAFAQPVRRWTLGFGVTETAMGVLFLRKQTRPLGVVAVVAQVIFLVRSFFTFRRSAANAG